MTTPADHRAHVPPLALTPEAAALKPKPAMSGSGTTTPGSVSPEAGGPKGPEPTRFGDWEQKGRCSDF